MSLTARTTLTNARSRTVTVAVTALLAAALVAPQAADATPRQTEKNPTAFGRGGAVSTVDPEATEAGLQVLRRGGNAADAAVAAAAALGVTEPYSAGIGGGGYFVYYNAKTRKVSTIDGRETAPASMPNTAFLDPATGVPYPFTPQLVSSGVSVGVPGTPATWQAVLKAWGSRSLAYNLQPAIDIAKRGFVVDQTFRGQTLDNKARFAAFPATASLYLPGGDAPQVGTVFRNPDLAATYSLIAKKGVKAFYTGPVASDTVTTVQNPPKDPASALPAPKGYMTKADLAGYEVVAQKPTSVNYRGLDVYGMAPSSSGGTTIGEALNILSTVKLPNMTTAKPLHYYLDASALAFADRGAYVGDPAYVDVPTKTLLSKKFAASRACLLAADKALPTPTAAGELNAKGCKVGTTKEAVETEKSTTHLVTADRWGNVASYTLTIEQTGGSGIVVPGRGFLLNNELTDFSLAPVAGDPNIIEGGKRPRSSMSPTIVLKHNKPVLALGSPGGSTIITTVLQTLLNRLDGKMSLEQAVAAPRASHRNAAAVTAEPAFIEKYGSVLTPYGYTLTPSGDAFTSAAEIGALEAIEFYPGGFMKAVAEPVRRGGGDAGVVWRLK